MVLSPNMDSSSFARHQTRRAWSLYQKGSHDRQRTQHLGSTHCCPGTVLQKGSITLRKRMPSCRLEVYIEGSITLGVTGTAAIYSNGFLSTL